MQNQDNFKHYGVVKGIERWDNLIDWEQELAAIDTYSNTGEFNSLMHVTTFTDGLYATNYYINMAAGDVSTKDGWGFKNNFDPRDMDQNQDNEWGPGHELGHMHQGAINWPSTTESSNNLFSNYVVYKIGKWGHVVVPSGHWLLIGMHLRPLGADSCILAIRTRWNLSSRYDI